MGSQAALAYIIFFGGYNESKTEPSEQRIAEIFNSKWDHNYCRISPREAQYSSRQGTLKKGQQRMEVKPQDTSEAVLCKGSSRNRSVCHQSDNSAPSVFLLEKRHLEPGKRCISTKLEESKDISFLPFSLVIRVLKEVQKEQASLHLIAPA